jgi:hypothetical protein
MSQEEEACNEKSEFWIRSRRRRGPRFSSSQLTQWVKNREQKVQKSPKNTKNRRCPKLQRVECSNVAQLVCGASGTAKGRVHACRKIFRSKILKISCFQCNWTFCCLFNPLCSSSNLWPTCEETTRPINSQLLASSSCHSMNALFSVAHI